MATLEAQRLLPVVDRVRPEDAGMVGTALSSAGLSSVEVTLRRPYSVETLEAMVASRPGLLVGAGTVLDAAQVDRVVAAGAAFVVSPACLPEVVARCRDHGIPVLPGVATPTEVARAVADGLDVLKVFPAGLLGGTAMVAALAAVFPTVRFVPSGGVGPPVVPSYLAQSAVLAVSGSWFLTPELVGAGPRALVAAATDAVRLTSQAAPRDEPGEAAEPR